MSKTLKPGDEVVWKPKPYMMRSATFIRYVNSRNPQHAKERRFCLITNRHRKTPIKIESRLVRLKKEPWT